MSSQNFEERLASHVQDNYHSGDLIEGITRPQQGMSSSVFFIEFSNGIDYAIKYGKRAMKDVPALDLISKQQIKIPVPTLIASFLFENVPVIILKKINFPLLESVKVEEMPKYIPSVINNLHELHTIQSDTPGLLNDRIIGETWKGVLLSVFDGEEIDWTEVSGRSCLDSELLLSSIEKIKKKIENTVFDLNEYSLLHTDFNQKNLFVDPANYEISGIIDWEDAMFGDPLYDFARIRMYAWQLNFNQQSVDDYYGLLNFSSEQKRLEDLYWLIMVIQYLAWYSEKLTDFNVSRINLHQTYLRNYAW